MALTIERNDIINVCADAIVNTANPEPTIGSGIDNAIYKACGVNELLTERKKIGIIKRGEAKATPSFNMSKKGVKYIIHTVGVHYKKDNNDVKEILKRCYENSLSLAYSLNCKSIALPLLATGNYEFPKEVSLQIGLSVINDFILNHDIDVTLVIYDKKSLDASTKIFGKLKEYIDENYVKEKNKENYSLSNLPLSSFTPVEINYFEEEEDERSFCTNCPPFSLYSEHISSSREVIRDEDVKEEFEKFYEEEEEASTFSDRLRYYMKKKGDLSNPDVYKPISLDRKVFNRIINGKYYVPRKITVLAIGLSLKLTIDEFNDFLECAGFTFMPSSLFDTIVKFCVINSIYDINEINNLLLEYNLKGIGIEE